MLPSDRDIDREARRNGPIDIGADETTECWRYYITLICDATHAPIGTPVKVTACVFDSVEMNQPEAGYELGVSVDAGQIVSVTRSGSPVTLPALTQSTYGITDANGNVDAYVTRNTQGFLNATCTITQCELPASRTAQVYFGPAVDVVFVIDATQSMVSWPVQSGVIATVEYLRGAGVTLAVGGVAFRDSVINPVYELSMDVDGFIVWVNTLTLSGGDDTNENALAAVKEAAELAPGCYVALATDAGFHYAGDTNDPQSESCLDASACQFTTLTAAQVRTILLNANCKVYIDAGNGENDSTAIDDYTDAMLYVNGAMEDTSFGLYTFSKLKAAVLQ